MKEPLLTENPDRFVIYPIKYHDIWSLYKKSIASFWTVEEIDLTSDKSDWDKLTDNERYFVKNVLAFFASSDGIVLEHLNCRVMSEIQIPEARFFYANQEMMETIHSEMYSLMIETFITDPEERAATFRSMYTNPSIEAKAKWAMKWMNNPDASFAQRLVAFCCVEGIYFSGSFCAIYWLKKRGLMRGLTSSNEFISRDETLHVDHACLLYRNYIANKMSEKEVHAMVKEALDVEKQFILDSLPCSLVGMNSTEMSEYLEFISDGLLVKLGYNKLFNTKNPFEWMNLICLQSKANFFENRSTSYQMPGVIGTVEQRQVKFDDEF